MNNDNKPAAAQEAVASVISYKPLERTAVITWAHVQNGGDPDWLRCGAKLFAAPVAAALVESPTEPIGGNECPVTGLPFYDNMEHPERGMIAMYGGPFDVYSIPELGDDDELRRERYDLDADNWVEGGEPLGYFYREQQAEAGSTPAAPGIDLEQFRELEGKCQRIQENRDFWHGVAEKLREELFEAREEQAKKIVASPKDGSDSARLDALEKLVDDSGGALLLHHGCDNGRGFNGLGLRNTGRTLRQAIDQATSAEVGA